MASSVAGPSRPRTATPSTGLHPPAPSTSGDSESTGPKPVERGLDVGILAELAKSALIESLSAVRFIPPEHCFVGSSYQIQGAKTLVLDKSLSGPLGSVTEISLFKVES